MRVVGEGGTDEVCAAAVSTFSFFSLLLFGIRVHFLIVLLMGWSRYKNLVAVDRDIAVKTFEKNRAFYHPICRGLVEKDLFGK